jgi:hypothetical protein
MFVKPGPSVIQSDEGFSVEVLGFTKGLLYTEGPKTLHIESEMSVGPAGLVIYPSSIKSWDPLYDNEVIDEAKRATIVDNVRRAFRFEGFEIDVL